MSMYTESTELKAAIIEEGKRLAKCESQEWENGDEAMVKAAPIIADQREKLMELAEKAREFRHLLEKYRQEAMY